jgi:predicted Rossmann fold flavoprotein
MTAAISASRRGVDVLLCEKMPRLGKKLLVSGSGRCNLLNENLDESFYNPAAKNLVKSVFAQFGKAGIMNFFKTLGLETYSQDGRVFPVANQASSVTKVLEIELGRLNVPVELDFEVSAIHASDGVFAVRSKTGMEIRCAKIILAAGGKSYPALGSDGGSYKFAKQFGHAIVEPVPSAVPVVVKDRLCHTLQGQKIFAKARSVVDGKVLSESPGELLFTKYGLSGTAILDISEEISIALNRNGRKDAAVSVDMVPFLGEAELNGELKKRLGRGVLPADLLVGILPNKFSTALKDILSGTVEDMTKYLKRRHFKVIGTRGWNEAEFTAGGIDVNEVKAGTLESRLKKRLYFAGEILDVNGKRGGYNLGWAWASGFVAGLEATKG